MLTDGTQWLSSQQLFTHSQIFYSIGQSVCHFPSNIADNAITSLQAACSFHSHSPDGGSSLNNIISLGIDVANKTIYMADNGTHNIIRVQLSLNSSNDDFISDIIVGNTGMIEGK